MEKGVKCISPLGNEVQMWGGAEGVFGGLQAMLEL